MTLETFRVKAIRYYCDGGTPDDYRALCHFADSLYFQATPVLSSAWWQEFDQLYWMPADLKAMVLTEGQQV